MDQKIPRKDRTISKEEAAYMAGLMDGEGTFSLTKIRQNRIYKNGERSQKFSYQLHINMYNTNKELLDWVIEHIGGTFYEHKSRKGMKPNWKTRYMVFFSNKEDKKDLINTILPYLTIKKKQALASLEFLDLFHKTCPEKREELRQRILKLNDSSQGRSKSVTTNTSGTSKEVEDRV